MYSMKDSERILWQIFHAPLALLSYTVLALMQSIVFIMCTALYVQFMLTINWSWNGLRSLGGDLGMILFVLSAIPMYHVNNWLILKYIHTAPLVIGYMISQLNDGPPIWS